MTREEFIKVLRGKGYSYREEGDKIVVTHKEEVWLDSLETLPPHVEFRNKGYVSLPSLKSIPPGVKFKNQGHINLKSLETLPSGMKFGNKGHVQLDSLKSIPSGVEFSDRGGVYLSWLIGCWFSGWKGSIEGIGSNRLLNKMISIGLFDRR